MAPPSDTMPSEGASAQAQLEALYAKLPIDARRERAFQSFQKIGLPHRRIEGWRWSDVRAALANGGSAGGELPVDVLKTDAKPAIRVVDGIVSLNRPAGVQVSERKSAPAFNSAEAMPMAALAVAVSDLPASLDVDVVTSPAAPLRFVFEGHEGFHAQHITVVVREGVEASVLESYLASGGFLNTVVEYILEPGAVLNRLVYQDGTSEAVQLTTATVHLGRGAQLKQTAAGFGGKLARLETRVWHDAGGSKATLNAAYVANPGRHVDFTSEVRHSVPDCETEQTVKGAIKAKGTGVFQGKFYVARDAQHTDAQMQHHTLLLEDGAVVNAKPELEIYADDVQCAHGNTAGALDERALFYIRQRGIPEAQARAMLTESFLAEAFEAADETLVGPLVAETRKRLLGGA